MTVLFCDIVGSTGLAERLGDEQMHELLRRFFDLALGELDRYGGSVDKFLGDGFMALVGVPRAYEDHARRAVLAAIAIRERLAAENVLGDGEPVRVRMGLNTGQVVVGTLGDDRGEDFTAVGDVINVAARLQALARPDEILIAEATARLARGYVRTEPLGPVDVRGRALPVGAHRVTARGRRRSPLPVVPHAGLSRFVGREHQQAALEDLLAEARVGCGQAVGIVAEPGMGKTRLMSEFRRAILGEPVTVLEGRCLSYGSAIPWVPVADIVRASCRVTDAAAPTAVGDGVRRALAQLGLDAERDAPIVLQLLGLREGREAVAALSPEAVRARTFDVLLRMSLAGSRRRPILLVIEDVHWIDRVSEEWLEMLVANLGGAAIMLACTYRPEYRAPWLQRSYASQLVLPRLGSGHAHAVVRGILADADAAAELADVVVARAEGNPFFLEELARALREPGGLGEDAPVPSTIHDVLAARVDRLPDEPRRVLQTASVLGREFGVRLLEEIWEGPAELPPLLAELTRLEFIVERPGPSEPLLAFKHALTQDVAYGGLLGPRRRALHEAAGAALERLHAGRLEEVDDRLAHHYARTDRSDKAVEYLDRFARRAVRSYAHAEASTALREALVHVERVDDAQRPRRSVDLVLRLVASLYFLGRFGESLDLLRHQEITVERIGDPGLSGPFYMWLGHTYTHAGDSEGAAQAIRRALTEAEPLGDLATVGKSHYVLAREGFWSGRLAEGAEHGRRAVAALDRTDDWWWRAHSHCWTGLNLLNLGRFEEALAEVARARAIGEQRSDPRILSYSAWNAGWMESTRGNWQAGIAHCSESLRTSPDRLNSAYSMGWLGFAYREGGDHDEAIVHLERSIALLTEFRYSRLVAWFTGWLSEAHLGRGDLDRALEVADQGLRVARELRYPWGIALARRALGRTALARGAVGEAERHLDEALRGFEEMGARFDATCTLLCVAEAAHVRRDAGLVRRLGGDCRRRFDELGTPVHAARADRLLAEVDASAAPAPA